MATTSGTNPIQAAIEALQWNIPYKRGGTTTSGMDPAGLVQWVFAQAGVSLPGRANQQYSEGNNIPVGPPGNALAYVQPGDVVFQGTSDPNTETEGIVYSTAGQGTIITSVPGKGVSYVPLTGQIDAIRRYIGTNSGTAAAPYSSTMPVYQVVSEGYLPNVTAPSGVLTPVQPSPKRLEFVIVIGVIGLVVLLRKKGLKR